jgi:hypothetical protein
MPTDYYNSAVKALKVNTYLSITAAFIFVFMMLRYERKFFEFMLENQNETLAPSNFSVKVTFKDLPSLVKNAPIEVSDY